MNYKLGDLLTDRYPGSIICITWIQGSKFPIGLYTIDNSTSWQAYNFNFRHWIAL